MSCCESFNTLDTKSKLFENVQKLHRQVAMILKITILKKRSFKLDIGFCKRKRYTLMFVLSLVGTCFDVLWASADSVPSLGEINRIIFLNNSKVKQGIISSRSVVTTDKEYYRGTPQYDRPNSSMLEGKHVSITREFIIFSKDNFVSSNNRINLHLLHNTTNVNTIWLDAANKTKITLTEREENVVDNGTVVVAHGGEKWVRKENINGSFVWYPYEGLQISPQEGRLSSVGLITGTVKYRGLDCLDVRWGGETGVSHISERVLVCPERDYRTLYHEFVEKVDKTINTEKYEVEKMQRIDDVWIPIQFRMERRHTYPDGTSGTQLRRSWINDFKPNSITTDSTFTPLLPPGLLVQDSTLPETEKRTSVIGGDVTRLLRQLRAGDFSILKESTGNIQ